MDAAWVHGRGADPRLPHLRESRVAILGCGSVGAPVALALAQAGVGEFALMDPEVVVPANIGRHPLGADAVGANKAEALARAMRLRLPHIVVDAYARRWDDVAREQPEILDRCDAIVSAIGEWSAEGALNEWHVSRNRRPGVIYGWTEAHACAGHAVAICETGGCLQCGLSPFGEPLLRVTHWPQGTTIRQEPACGAAYQPYGPIELAYVTTLVADLALDCLLDNITVSTERIWAGRRSLLEIAGGEWATEWLTFAAGRAQGGFVEERIWPVLEGCGECGFGQS